MKAAERLAAEVIVASNERQILEEVVPGKTLTLDFIDLEGSTRKVLSFAGEHPLQAVISTDEDGTVLASKISEALSLPHNPVPAAVAAKDKERLRETLTAAAVPTPPFQIFSTETAPEEIASNVIYPAVLKPTFLSASRGVIRVNNPGELKVAFQRLKSLLNQPDVRRLGGPAAKKVLIEQFIPGKEVALEGLLRNGCLSILALFDKPDPLEGPFFEETLYVTPSRLPDSVQKEIVEVTQRGTDALGLTEGPIHAELRINPQGAWIIELAARSIGGLCSRTLRFGTGHSLEEIILRHALGMPIESLERQKGAAGVMMIPIPKAGILNDYQGVNEARSVPGIEEVAIMIRRKQKVVPLPEGRRYLGFIFARGKDPEGVEAALREGHKRLRFDIAPSTP